MNSKMFSVVSLSLVSGLVLAGCSGAQSEPQSSGTDGDVTLTVSGWSLETNLEFQTLADGFSEKYPGTTIKLKEYDAAEYNTLVTADLAAGSGPDIITQKEVKYVTTLQDGEQLLDVSDVPLPEGLNGVESYKVDGVSYAVPYRQDSWVLFYNKDLFDQAGEDYPDGTWTWDDYAATAKKLTTAAVKGAYQHRWQSTVQGFASAQNDVNPLDGDFGHLTDYYEKSLDLQDSGAQVDFNTSSANQLTYQGEFGTQKAAMMLMGTWYIGTLITQQAAGEATSFEWGVAPAPQKDATTAGLENTPVTYGDPTGFGINANLASDKVDAAKKFLEYVASEEAAQALAAIGITPALTTEATADTYFGIPGAPSDELSRFAWSSQKVVPEYPLSDETAVIQGILADLHSEIMSESSAVDKAIDTAEERVKNEIG